MNKCIIVIPIYLERPIASEIASFKQVLTVLKGHEICIITYVELNLSVYKKIAAEKTLTFKVEYFDKSCFNSVKSYNDLCFSKDFYQRFERYDYMLIYQLDAWVFEDKLQYWVDKGYDYIGAPIFWAYNNKKFTHHIAGIGNGGLSLRKIYYCLETVDMPKYHPYTKPLRIIKTYYYLFKYNDKFKSFWKRIISIPVIILKCFGIMNTLHYYMKKKQINEDMIFGTNAKYAWGGKVKLPPIEEAISFSFELHPEMLYKKNGNKLPFGCHAFEKWDYDSFWSKYINFDCYE